MRVRPLVYVITAVLGIGGCAESDSEPTLPPGLADAPEPQGTEVYEESLRWPPPTEDRPDSAQIATVYRDADRLLLLRRGLDGRVHAWAEGSLTPAAREALDAAVAAADPSLGVAVDPCPWHDTNPAALILDGERYEFWTKCAGPGLDELARLHAGMMRELLACPFPSWAEEFAADPSFVLSFTALDCEADEPVPW